MRENAGVGHESGANPTFGSVTIIAGLVLRLVRPLAPSCVQPPWNTLRFVSPSWPLRQLSSA
jgi:hypothetical protein